MPALAPRGPLRFKPGSDSVSPALSRTLSRYSNLVRQAARRHNLAESDLDEVFQDVRIRLWRALATGERIAAAPASYVYRAAVSAALDLIRRRRARREYGMKRMEDGVHSGGARPDQDLAASELANRLSAAMGSLFRSRRVVVRLHLAGYHRNEIARILGWSEAKTRNLLYRGLSDLRRLLEESRESRAPG